MPIYEYLCAQCTEKFEAIRPIKDADEPMECPYCKSQDTRRMVSLFFAKSEGRVVAGGEMNCTTCNLTSCSTCGK